METAAFHARPAGPLDSHRKYLMHVALDNGQDYLRLLQREDERPPIQTPDQYKAIRYFLNAIESMNNVPEYLFWERSPDGSSKDLKNFITQVRATEPCLARIAEIANAYKHCGRFDSTKLHARDLSTGIVSGSISIHDGRLVSVQIDYHFDGIKPEHRKVLEEGWHFWFDYLNGGREILADGTVLECTAREDG